MSKPEDVTVIPRRTLQVEPSPRTASSRLSLSLKKARRMVKACLGWDREAQPATPLIPHGDAEAGALIQTTSLEAAVASRVGTVISGLLAELLSLDDADLDEETNLRELGLDSVTIVALSARVEEALGVAFDSTLLYELDTVGKVAARVARADTTSLAQRFEMGAEATNRAQTGRPQAHPLPHQSHPAATAAAEDVGPKATPAGALPADIAIIGLSGRYPQSDDVESFWRALIEERDLITEIPRDRWDWERYFGDPRESADSRTHSKWGGFLRDIRRFDAGFFRISPREAELMDPQQRLLLEEAWHVVEDSGYKPSALAGSRTGVYIGIAGDDYSNLMNQGHIKEQVYTATGSYLSVAANRISFRMGLHGPSIAMDAACASALVAICQAVSALRAGECPLAIAGGINLCITPRRFMAFSHAGMLSVDGRCKTFDRSANGYVRGEGVGLVLLKPARHAIADGDYIYGIIKGSTVNHGGLNTTITAPNPQAQADLIVAAMNQAPLDPDGISMIEAHGAGTSLGDPLEFRGLTRAFERLYQIRGKRAPSTPHIAVGAVKTNIGHLEAASGIAGLTKVLMAMKYGKIPKNLHFKELNPAIQLEGSPFYLPTRTQAWTTPVDGSGNPQPRRAGVSSFGFGGANAHVVVEAWDNERTACLESASALVFPLSASNGEGLRQHALRLADHLSAARDGALSPPPNVFDIAKTLQSGREALDHRLAILTSSLDELITHLRAVGEERPLPHGVWLGRVPRKRRGARAKPNLLSGDPATVCAAWVTGAEVDWPILAGHGRRTPLPGYVFRGEAHWLPDPPVRAAAALGAAESDVPVPPALRRLHPLVHGNASSIEGIRFLSHFTGSEFCLHDHIVAGKRVLPGTALLEMGRAAGALAGFEPTSLRDVHWASPIVVEEPRLVEIRLTADGEDYRFEVVSGGQQIHARGLLARGHVERPAPDPEDPARCPRELDPRSFYGRLEKLGLSLRGGDFEVIRALRVGPSEVFAHLALARSPDGVILHPALLDGALQTAYAVFFDDGDDRLQVPFAIERLSIFAPLPRSCRVHTKRTRVTATGVASFEIRIAGEDGVPVAAIDGFMARPLAAAREKPLAAEPESLIGSQNALLGPHWEAHVPLVEPMRDDRLVLLFDTDSERWQTLASHSGSRTLWIRPGPGFRGCEPGVFEVNPHDEDDYHALIRHLAGMDGELGGVIYLWGAENANPYLAFDSDAESVFAPMFLMTRALAVELPGSRVRMAVPYRANHSERAAAHAGLSGFARALARERSAPTLTLLALAGDDEPEAESWIQAALRGLSWRSPSGSVFDLKHDQVRIQVQRAIEVAEEPTVSLRANGSYLLTGGRGALGAMLARYLARRYGARLMLCATSAPDDSTRALVADLDGLGGTAHYVAADLADGAATRRLIAETVTSLGELHGIFHIAGRHLDHAIQDKDLAEALQILRPKVTGLCNLDLATADMDLDFIVSYSSLAPIVGLAGQTDYAFANGFLDAFTHVRNAWVAEGRRRGRTVSVNWPHWREGGMRLAPHVETWIREVTGLHPLEKADGLAILERVIRGGWAQVAVAPANGAAVVSEPVHAEPVTSTPADLDRQALEQVVGDLVRATLGISKLDPQRPLHEYGADSINLGELTNKINKRFGLRLTPVLFFDYTTLAALLDYLIETQRPALSKALAAVTPITTPVPAPVPAAPAARPVPLKPEPPAIAVVGMAGIMPGSPDLDAFWQHLVDGRDLVTEVPFERWDWRAYEGDPATEPNKTCSRWGGFMPGVDQFDYHFFGITRREAMLMDPQQRLLLALSWNAIEDAGHRAADLAGTPTGVFMGVSSFDYFDLMKNHQLDIEAHTSTGVVHSVLANRLSWFFDLTGPSLPVDTACSSSLIALHQAMEAMAAGSCRAALVGGVNLLVSPTIHISFGKAGMLSPRGRCRTFDASADGYVRAEGAGVVYLKTLADALADGDSVVAVIRGSAVNHGGRAKSLTAPNPKAQADLICRAHDQAGFAPETITYVEAHGTGTSLGDPIEIHGLKKAFERRLKEAGRTQGAGPWCGIGSVKTNIGHLEAGAAMAGLFKILLAMRAGVLPANIHQAQRNPYIELEDGPFYLLDSRREWKRLRDEAGREIPRRAGISSFGFGGANAHVVLEEHLPRDPRPAGPAGPWLLVLSARDATRLRERARDLAAFLAAGRQEPGRMADVAYTLQVGREPMPCRSALVVNGVEDAVQALGALSRGDVAEGRCWEGTISEDPPALAPDILERGDLDAIGRAFVQGAAVDWSRLPDVSARGRVRLPGYPFAPTRCWLPLADDRPPEGGVPRPRLDRHETASSPPSTSRPAGVRDFVLAFESLEALAVDWLIRKLLDLGVFVRGRGHYVWGRHRPSDLAPRMTRLFDALPHLLAQRNRASFDGIALSLTDPDFAQAAEQADLQAAALSLAESRPAVQAHVRLLITCMGQFEAVLTGRTRATDVLFPNADDGLVVGIYRNNPHADHLNRLLAERLGARVGSERYCILEVGAGTGGATQAVLDSLAGKANVDYTYTDVSHHFLEVGRAQFERGPVPISFAVLDLEKDPLQQGFQAEAFDAVLCANVLHATRRVSDTLGGLVRLLKPGGVLLINELTRPQAFLTLTFGLLEGWWRYDASEARHAGSPLLSLDQWRAALAAAGLGEPVIHGQEACGNVLAQHVIETSRIGSVVGARPREPEAERPHSPSVDLLGAVRLLLADNLRVALRETGPIALEKPFVDLGIDSIFGVELIGRLNEALGLSLKPNVLFDHPSPLKLAAHLVEVYPQPLATWLEVSAPHRPTTPDPAAVPAGNTVDAPARAHAPAPSSPDEVQPDVLAPAGGGRCLGVVLRRPEVPAQIRPQPAGIPEPGPGKVSIRVRAFSVSHTDVLCVQGLYPNMPEYPFTPGVEVAGEIAALGAGVSGFHVGERVVALAGGRFGGHASMAVADSYLTVSLPVGIAFEHAAAFPVGFLVMARSLTLAAVGEGDRVLIQGAGGGAGVIGVQMALQRGAEVFATAGSAAKLTALRALGAHHVVNYHESDFAERIRVLTGGAGVDVVINSVAGAAMQKGLDLLAPGGRYVETAVLALRASGIDLRRLVDNQSYFSVDLRRYLSSHPQEARRLMAEMAKTLAEGRVKPVVAKSFAFEEVHQAYAWLLERRNVGRVVVSVPRSLHDDVRPRISEIAVVGMAGRYPQAEDLEAFWTNLAQGRNCVQEVPRERWSIDDHYDSKPRTPGRTYCRSGGFLDHVDLFDASFFNISGTEAARMDPQQRLFLETAWEAMEQAGYAHVRRQRCGVYVGAGFGDYQNRFLSPDMPPTAHVFSGNQASILAARIAYHLDLRGAAVAVDTACSSSLVALHLACESIRSGESDLAIAGGVFVSVTPSFHVLSSQMGMLSPSGRCAAFDAEADGFVPGEGVGAVVLKPLDKALADGDHIWGVIRGTGVNQDGATNGITAPSTQSQTELLEEVYRAAGISIQDIGYVEAHGTGTRLGDPIEVEALTRAFAAVDRPGQVALGSVKSNIGHTSMAAGIAGLTKVLLALSHRQVPPSLHFRQPNPLIPFAGTPFFVNTELIPWPEPPGGTRLAAVSSFGFSGTNSHVVVAEPPRRPALADHEPFPTLVAFSGPRPADADRHVRVLARFLSERRDELRLIDVAYTLNARRTHFQSRVVFLVTSLAELRSVLGAYTRESPPEGCIQGRVDAAEDFSRLDGQVARDLERSSMEGPPGREALVALGNCFVRGYPLDWGTLYRDHAPRCLPLPGYPLDRRRYWVEESNKASAPEAAARGIPEAGARTRSASARVFALPDALDSELFFVRDHRVEGRPLLPGVAYLELAAARWEQLDPLRPAAGFRDLTFVRPLFLNAQPSPIEVEMTAEGRFSLRSGPGAEEHARGLLALEAAPAPADQPRFEQAIQGMSEESAADFYGRLARSGCDYGPGMRAVIGFHRGNGAAVARLRLPAEAGAVEDFRLHPALLDGALQAVAGIRPGERPRLPFFIESVQLHRPCQAEMVAHVAEDAEDRFSLRLTDPEGRVAVAMSGICAREARGSDDAGKAGEVLDPLEGLFFRPLFARIGPASTADPAAFGAHGVLIVHRPDGPLHEELARQHAGQPVYRLGIGDATRRISEEEWEVEPGDTVGLDRVVGELPPFDLVYFLAGLQHEDEALDVGTLEAHETRGVMTLFHLVQALARHRQGRDVALKAVANGSALGPGGSIKPLSAHLHGFCRSAAREMSHIHFTCLDVGPEDLALRSRAELEAVASAIAAEPTGDQGRLVVLRGGERHARHLAPVRLPALVAGTPYRRGGTYLILGGAGGIGMVLSRHLVQTVGARVVLVGRRAPSELAGSIDALRARGGDVLYLQADASRPGAMNAAVEQIHARFGPIHGAIHSAMVLKDRLIENMSGVEFDAALSPKTRATVQFCRALEHEPLDFLLLFSSLQSFVGGPGQSNYASGCTFLDAFSESWRGRVAYPVKLLHWGYWGSVGVVASETYRRRMAEMGLHSIEPGLGMEALDRFLASPWERLLVVRAETRFLEEIGVQDEPVWHTLPTQRAPLGVAFESSARVLIPGSEVERAMTAVGELEAWCGDWVPALLVRLGLDPAASQMPAPAELTDRRGIQSRFVPLLQALFHILEQTGYASAPGAAPSWDLQVVRGLAMQDTSIAAVVNLVQSCVDSFQAVVTGAIPAPDVLFPNGSDHLVAGVYRDNPIADYYNGLARDWLEAYLQEHKRAGIGGALRILEVGAGTGGTTEALLGALNGHDVRYWFSDLSSALVSQARGRLARHRRWLQCRVFDLEKDPLRQGLHPGSFDLIVAGNSIHATSDVTLTLRRLKSLLASDGWLLLNELTADHRFATLSFGLLEGWWAFRDGWRRLPHSPLLEPRRWVEALEENGFHHVTHLGPSGPGGLRQRLVVGQSNGQIALAGKQTLASVGRAPDEVEVRPSAPPSPPEASLDATRGDKELDVELVCTRISAIMGQVLEVVPSELEWDSPHQRFGVDSILAVDIVDRINRDLGVALRSTDFFNFVTIRELARHVVALVARGETPPGLEGEAPGVASTAEPAPLSLDEGSDEAALLDLFRKVASGDWEVEEASHLMAERSRER